MLKYYPVEVYASYFSISQGYRERRKTSCRLRIVYRLDKLRLPDFEDIATIMQNRDDPYVPPELRGEKALAAFNKELINAVACCQAVEQTEWTPLAAGQVIRKARDKNGHCTVRAVSPPSERSCTQRFMAFEAEEDGHITYIIAFRSDQECYEDMVSKQERRMENDTRFQVHKSLWRRAATMPLHSLPLHWWSGLRIHRHRLLLTGFSVGGAVAALATLQLLQAKDAELRRQICCYTFGAPLQGDKKYANRINQKFASNFYHVMINEDPIPGVLTLLSKMADNQPDTCRAVARNIFTLLASTAQVAAAVALNCTVAPGAGAIIVPQKQIDFAKLGSRIKSLVVLRPASGKPEYKFGGSLVLLDCGENSHNFTLSFVQLPGDGRVLEGVFSVQEMNVTPSSLQRGVDQLETFCEAINDMDNEHLFRAIKYVYQISREPVLSQKPDQGLSHVSEKAMDGAGRVANSIAKSGKNLASNAVQSMRCFGTPKVAEDEEDNTSTDIKCLLKPQFDKMPMKVWLDNEIITIGVYGENMVLGIHVLYLDVNGEEKLRIPCTEITTTQPVDAEEAKDLQKAFSNLPLQFSTQVTKGLSFSEAGGSYRIHLAFGSQTVEASKVIPSVFDSWRDFQVAERFSKEPPSKLVDLLIVCGMATAQAQCTAANYAIQNLNPRDADNVVKETLEQVLKVPREFDLLDRLLFLVDTGHSLPDNLPSEMRDTLRDTLRDTTKDASDKSKLAVPYFSPGNESMDWTFSGRYTHTIKRMITKEMLSEKKTAEELSTSLEKELADGPKQMVVAYLNDSFEYKSYAGQFSIGSLKSWKKEKKIVVKGVDIFAKVGGAVPIVTVPLYYGGKKLDSIVLKCLSIAIGGTTGAFAGVWFGSAWWLYHVVSWPIRHNRNRPGLMDDWNRTRRLADNWEKMLQEAALLFQCETERPLNVACALEHKLYNRLEEAARKYSSFNSTTLKCTVNKASYEEATALKVANYGLAGAWMYKIRRHLTERKITLGLIGTSQSGKSTFASEAFNVDSNCGIEWNNRTRVLRQWILPFPENENRQFMLIDFPGSNDRAAPNWYIRAQSLASVLVVVLSMREMNNEQAKDLVRNAIEVRRKDKEASVLFCFTFADHIYEKHEMRAKRMGGNITAAKLFTENFESYKKELLEAVRDAEHLTYLSSRIHPCCFDEDGSYERKEKELEAVGVKNVQGVKELCLKELLRINKC